MKKIGLTGGMGSGKTYVAGIFEHFGIPVFYADNEAKKILDSPDVIIKLEHLFETNITKPGEAIADRKKIASIVFKDPNKLKHLNELIHPLTRQYFEDWALLHTSFPYVIKEAAVMFESGSNKCLHKVICVTAPEGLRIQRVVERDGSGIEQVKERINNQLKEEERIELSDYIITNNGKELLVPQVVKIHQAILALT